MNSARQRATSQVCLSRPADGRDYQYRTFNSQARQTVACSVRCMATACLVPGSVAVRTRRREVNDHGVLDVEHPRLFFGDARRTVKLRVVGQLARSVS